MSHEVLVQTILQLRDLGGARLDICNGENGYILPQFCIATSGNDLRLMLNNLCPFGSTVCLSCLCLSGICLTTGEPPL